jgi:hypothetical protein
MQRSFEFEGTEMDFTSHELGFALRLLLKGNGNVLERCVTPFQVFTSPLTEELRALARGSVSRKFYRHYRGFFARQLSEVVKAERPTAKELLYAYRAALTGVHLLTTGKCVGDVQVLAEQYGFAGVTELLVAKRSGTEHGVVSFADEHRAEFVRWRRCSSPRANRARCRRALRTSRRSRGS